MNGGWNTARVLGPSITWLVAPAPSEYSTGIPAACTTSHCDCEFMISSFAHLCRSIGAPATHSQAIQPATKGLIRAPHSRSQKMVLICYSRRKSHPPPQHVFWGCASIHTGDCTLGLPPCSGSLRWAHRKHVKTSDGEHHVFCYEVKKWDANSILPEIEIIIIIY